jgi:S-adenosylmethionine:tRNA ribosyltransferase-isomerase
MDTTDLDYLLPPDAVAQRPVEPRDRARLLVDRGPGHEPEHRTVADLADLLHAGDVLVVNDTRVRRARLRLHKPSGGAVEVFLLEDLGGGRWEALVGPSRKAPPGTVLSGVGVTVVAGAVLDGGRRLVEVDGDVDGAGEIPLPPYIHQPLADPERYQTVFARTAASAAAPTAGLHLTTGLLERCRERGVTVAAVELVVGLDTFKPIVADRVEDHPIHTEAYTVPEATMAACRQARRVVAVGTTVVRSLETAAATGRLQGRSDLFIRPGHAFAVVDRLLTNFHVPRTTLLSLVEAFVGPRWRHLYEIALRDGYRFLSFGDASLLTRSGIAP